MAISAVQAGGYNTYQVQAHNRQITSPGQSSLQTKDTVNLSDAAKAMATNASSATESSVTPLSSNSDFSSYAEKMMKLRGVSGEQKNLFANVMQRAEEQVENPGEAKNFLSSLSSVELAAVQKVHSLGDKIAPESLDIEGAYNLLHQPGDVKDFNDDGFVKMGKATTFVFPPPNAPQNVKDAWEETTANMTDEEKLKATIPFLPLPDIRQEGNSYVVVNHDDPDYRNPYKVGSLYQDRVSELLGGNEASKHLNSREGYEETKELLETFLTALEKYNCY